MIFDYILAQLDGELARWQQLRAIVATLETPADIAVALSKPALGPLPALTPATLPRRRRPGAAGPRSHRVSRLWTPEPKALTNVIPAGPVVVSAAALREQATQPKLLPAPVPETPDPESLLRELSQRWGTGATPHPA